MLSVFGFQTEPGPVATGKVADGADAGDAALYGSRQRFDAGALDDGLQFHLAAGVRLPYRLRAQLEFGLAGVIDWWRSTNYRAPGGRRPSEARARSRVPQSMSSNR